VDGIAVWQAGDGIGIGQHAQPLLSAAFLGNIGTGTDKENFIFTAAAVNEFVSEQKQSLPFTRFDPAFDFVGAAVTKETGNIAFEAAASLRLINSLNTF
jgi:hypothetical protein